MSEGVFGKLLGKNSDYLFFVFRVLAGLVFFLHGASKLGWLGGNAMTGIMMWVGIGETLVGLGVLLGVWTRLAALGGIVIMLSAWFKAHVGRGWNPLANGGEAAVLFFAIFLVLLAYGAGKWALEKLWAKKEFF